MAEGARLESVYTATYRGFESPPHRHILRRARMQVRAFFRTLHLPDAAQAPYPAYIATALHISVGLISEAPSGMAVIVG